jgi:hypothetical protein
LDFPTKDNLLTKDKMTDSVPKCTLSGDSTVTVLDGVIDRPGGIYTKVEGHFNLFMATISLLSCHPYQ